MRRVFAVLAVVAGTVCPLARATYSIVACDAMTRACGVAVQTNNLAVGASVPYAAAGVGAIASQFETNPMYGPRGLELLRQGMAPEEALQALLKADGNFDGQGAEARQVGVVSVDGRSFAYTGRDAAASPWAGSRTGKGYSIQGNGLAGPQVLEAMERTFLGAKGPLAERLMEALEAGDRAGGQSTGKESAALVVRTAAGFPVDVDLRVDHAANPVDELRGLLRIQNARQMLVQARQAADKGNTAQAETLLVEGVALAPGWPRIWIQGARLAAQLERPELASQYLNVAFGMNAAWVEQEIGDGRYALIGADPAFHRWVKPEQEKAARDAGERLEAGAPAGEKLHVADRLLEAGAAGEALRLLGDSGGTETLPRSWRTAKVQALLALGRREEARRLCAAGEPEAGVCAAATQVSR